MTKQELTAKIEAAGKIYGTFENVTIIDNAYHACNPSNSAEWCANGFVFDGESLRQVEVKWDFSEVPGYEENDDASSLLWDCEELMSIGNEVDNFCLADEDDIVRAANRIEK